MRSARTRERRRNLVKCDAVDLPDTSQQQQPSNRTQSVPAHQRHRQEPRNRRNINSRLDTIRNESASHHLPAVHARLNGNIQELETRAKENVKPGAKHFLTREKRSRTVAPQRQRENTAHQMDFHRGSTGSESSQSSARRTRRQRPHSQHLQPAPQEAIQTGRTRSPRQGYEEPVQFTDIPPNYAIDMNGRHRTGSHDGLQSGNMTKTHMQQRGSWDGRQTMVTCNKETDIGVRRENAGERDNPRDISRDQSLESACSEPVQHSLPDKQRSFQGLFRSATSDISKLDSSSTGSTSQVAIEDTGRGDSRTFVAPWRQKSRPSSQIIQPTSDAAKLLSSLSEESYSVKTDASTMRSKLKSCDSTDFDDLVEANVDAANDLSNNRTSTSNQMPILSYSNKAQEGTIIRSSTTEAVNLLKDVLPRPSSKADHQTQFQPIAKGKMGTSFQKRLESLRAELYPSSKASFYHSGKLPMEQSKYPFNETRSGTNSSTKTGSLKQTQSKGDTRSNEAAHSQIEYGGSLSPIGKEILYDPPKPHVVNKLEDPELVGRIATVNNRENKKKQLIEKLTAIRQELATRIGSLDAKQDHNRFHKGEGPANPSEQGQVESPVPSTPKPIKPETSSKSRFNQKRILQKSHTLGEELPDEKTLCENIDNNLFLSEEKSSTWTTPQMFNARGLGIESGSSNKVYDHLDVDTKILQTRATSPKSSQKPVIPEFGTSYLPPDAQTPWRRKRLSDTTHNVSKDIKTASSEKLHGAISLVHTIQNRLAQKSNATSESPTATLLEKCESPSFGISYVKPSLSKNTHQNTKDLLTASENVEKQTFVPVQSHSITAPTGPTNGNPGVSSVKTINHPILIESRVKLDKGKSSNAVQVNARADSSVNVTDIQDQGKCLSVDNLAQVSNQITDEERRRQLYNEDSYKESSPEYSPMALPKDSVILRNKFQCIKRRGSTSSDSEESNSKRSPRHSPRAARKFKSNRGSTSSSVSLDYAGIHLNVPGTPTASAKEGRRGSSRNSPRGSTASLTHHRPERIVQQDAKASASKQPRNEGFTPTTHVNTHASHVTPSEIKEQRPHLKQAPTDPSSNRINQVTQKDKGEKDLTRIILKTEPVVREIQYTAIFSGVAQDNGTSQSTASNLKQSTVVPEVKTKPYVNRTPLPEIKPQQLKTDVIKPQQYKTGAIKPVTTDSDHDLKGSRVELDSAIETLDALTKDLENRKRVQEVVEETLAPLNIALAEGSSSQTPSDSQVSDALAVLKATSPKEKSFNRGGNFGKRRPRSLIISHSSEGFSVASPPIFHTQSPPVTAPVIAEDRGYILRDVPKRASLPSHGRPKSGIGASILNKLEKEEKTHPERFRSDNFRSGISSSPSTPPVILEVTSKPTQEAQPTTQNTDILRSKLDSPAKSDKVDASVPGAKQKIVEQEIDQSYSRIYQAAQPAPVTQQQDTKPILSKPNTVPLQNKINRSALNSDRRPNTVQQADEGLSKPESLNAVSYIASPREITTSNDSFVQSSNRQQTQEKPVKVEFIAKEDSVINDKETRVESKQTNTALPLAALVDKQASRGSPTQENTDSAPLLPHSTQQDSHLESCTAGQRIFTEEDRLADMPSTKVEAVMSRLNRRRSSESPSRDSPSNRKFDVKTGARDVSSLAKKFGEKKETADNAAQSKIRQGNNVNTTTHRSISPRKASTSSTEAAKSRLETTKTRPETTKSRQEVTKTRTDAVKTRPETTRQSSLGSRKTPERFGNVQPSRKTPDRTVSTARGAKDSNRNTAPSNRAGVELNRQKPSSAADNELTKALHRRSHYLEDYEKQSASSEGETSADKSVAAYEIRLAKEKRGKDAVGVGTGLLVDKHLPAVLESRKVKQEVEGAVVEGHGKVTATQSKQRAQPSPKQTTRQTSKPSTPTGSRPSSAKQQSSTKPKELAAPTKRIPSPSKQIPSPTSPTKLASPRLATRDTKQGAAAKTGVATVKTSSTTVKQEPKQSLSTTRQVVGATKQPSPGRSMVPTKMQPSPNTAKKTAPQQHTRQPSPKKTVVQTKQPSPSRTIPTAKQSTVGSKATSGNVVTTRASPVRQTSSKSSRAGSISSKTGATSITKTTAQSSIKASAQNVDRSKGQPTSRSVAQPTTKPAESGHAKATVTVISTPSSTQNEPDVGKSGAQEAAISQNVEPTVTTSLNQTQLASAQKQDSLKDADVGKPVIKYKTQEKPALPEDSASTLKAAVSEPTQSKPIKVTSTASVVTTIDLQPVTNLEVTSPSNEVMSTPVVSKEELPSSTGPPVKAIEPKIKETEYEIKQPVLTQQKRDESKFKENESIVEQAAVARQITPRSKSLQRPSPRNSLDGTEFVVTTPTGMKVRPASSQPMINRIDSSATPPPSVEPTKSILKSSRESSLTRVDDGNLTPILKKKSFSEEHPHQSILKKRVSENDLHEQKPTVSILKRDAAHENEAVKEIKPILKKDTAFDSRPLPQALEPISLGKEIKPILKKDTSFDKHQQSVTSSILVHPQPQTEKHSPSPPSILKSSKQFMLQKSRSFGDRLPTKNENKTDSPSAAITKATLRKAKTFDFSGEIDAELAATLRARRGESEESDHSNKGDNGTANNVEQVTKGVSVAERIFHMQSKLEERSAPVTRFASEGGTPRLQVVSSLSMPGSPGVLHTAPPHRHESQSPTSSTVTSLTSDDVSLLARLSDVAQEEELSEDRRNRFQKSRDTWRRKTQPVTLTELHKHDESESQGAKVIETTTPQRTSHSNRFKNHNKANIGRFKSLPELGNISDADSAKEKKEAPGAIETVPADLVKQKADLFETKSIPEISILSPPHKSFSDEIPIVISQDSIQDTSISYSSSKIADVENQSDKIKSSVLESQSAFSPSQARYPEKDLLQVQPLHQKPSSLGLESEEKSISKSEEISSPDYEILSDNGDSDESDDWDALVEINARTLMGESPTEASRRVSLTRSSPKLTGPTFSSVEIPDSEDKTEDKSQEDENESSPEDEKSKLSVTEKMSLFRQIAADRIASAKAEEVIRPHSPQTFKRFQDRKKRMERARTQPISEHEVRGASQFAANQRAEQAANQRYSADVTHIAPSGGGETQDVEAQEDELSKLSLAEKMQLFNSPQFKGATEPVLEKGPRRKGRKTHGSRFKTQPITTDEVAKARISPLAMSLVKPPENEMIKGMSFREQREFIARNAELTLSGETLTASHTPGSPRSENDLDQSVSRAPASTTTSTTPGLQAHDELNVVHDDTVDVVKPKGILRLSSDGPPDIKEPKSILKQDSNEDNNQVKGILKSNTKMPLLSKQNSYKNQTSDSDSNTLSDLDLKRHSYKKDFPWRKKDRNDNVSKVDNESNKTEVTSYENSIKSKSELNGNYMTDSTDQVSYSQSGDHTFKSELKSPIKLSSPFSEPEDTNNNVSEVEWDQLYESALEERTPDSTKADDSVSTSIDTSRTDIPLKSRGVVSKDGSTDPSQKRHGTIVTSSSDYNTASDMSDLDNTPANITKPAENKSEVISEETQIESTKNAFEKGKTAKTVVERDNILQDSTDSRFAVSDTNTSTETSITTNVNEIQKVSEKSRSTSASAIVPGEMSRVSMAKSKLSAKGIADSSTDDDVSNKRGSQVTSEAPPVRRRFNRDFRKQSERYHTQPVDGELVAVAVDNDIRPTEKPGLGHARHRTEPVTPTEKQEAAQMGESPTRVKGNSIAERLALLHKSGEDGWRRRAGKSRDSTSPASSSSDTDKSRLQERTALLTSKENSPEPVKMRTNRAVAEIRNSERPNSIANRLSWLDDAKEGWRGRVSEKDMSKFTVEGKLSSYGKRTESPIVKKGQTRNALSRVTEDSDVATPPQLGTPVLQARKGDRTTMTPAMCSIGLTPTDEDEAKSSPNIPASMHVVQSAAQLSTGDDEEDEAGKEAGSKVSVPRVDDETFRAFYEQVDTQVVLRQKVAVSVDDFDHLFIESEDILTPTRKARPQQRKNRASRNPLRALAAREDVQDEYEEQFYGVAERELKRLKTEQISGKATLASEALAGLASKESFDKTKLRKAESFSGASPGGDKFQPFSDLMLLHVKGRRTCQTRLVRPVAASINSGDVFILVLPDKVYVWLGEFCNIIEKSKALDIASTIQQKRDLGCKTIHDPIILYESKNPGSSAKDFWKHLGGFGKYQDPGPPEEDELYEMYINETNMVYQVHGDKLVPLQEYWGQLLRHQLLHPKEMYLFDFGSEVYLWTGKQVPFASRKIGLRLLQEIANKGYDYSTCDINPLSPLHTAESGGSPSKSNKRPPWVLVGKVNQNMETVLFREKFCDWPDKGKLIKVKDNAEKDVKRSDSQAELVPCDVAPMVEPDDTPIDLILEGSHLGRGDQWVDDSDGIVRITEVKTLDVVMWHVLEYEHYQLDELSQGQFHEGDTYVIKWHYMTMQAGIKSLKTKEARNTTTGREKCAYFFWQGRHSSITEKGASALMTVELDEERGPQVRVVQGKEPPAFLQLFQGRMVTHRGKREEPSESLPEGGWRLFLVRNEIPGESYLQEVLPCVQSLRSRASFVLLSVKSGHLYIWHGAKSSTQTRECATNAANLIKTRKPPELGIAVQKSVSVTECNEGEEKTEFWSALGATSRRLRTGYHSLSDVRRSYKHSPRVINMNSVSGTFEAHEVLNPSRSNDHPSPFTALQSDLTKVPQPGLFLVDDQSTVYLWQGSWPEETAEVENVTTGSAQSRFNTDRICAMQTVLNYCQAKNSSRQPAALLVYGGIEPLEFQNLFPVWEVDEKARQKQLSGGLEEGVTVPIKDYLHKLTQTKYTWAELTSGQLPEGVDPSRMDKFLKEEEFESGLGISQEDFYKLPQWKQTSLKREKGMF